MRVNCTPLKHLHVAYEYYIIASLCDRTLPLSLQRSLSPNDLDSLLMSVHKEDDYPITHLSTSSAPGNHASVYLRSQAGTGQHLSQYPQAYSRGSGGHVRGSRAHKSEPTSAPRAARLASSQGADGSRSAGYIGVAGYPYPCSDSHERARPAPQNWSGEFPSSSVRESGFQPKWTSTMTASKVSLVLPPSVMKRGLLHA